MKSLLVIYDSSIEDEGRDSYLGAIKKNVQDLKVTDIKDGMDNVFFNQDYVLILKPMSDKKYGTLFSWLRGICPEKDIEGMIDDGFTITAQALARVILGRERDNIEAKTIVIINQSEVLGQSLAKYFIDWGANVININSKYKDLDNLLAFTNIDILVSASGSYDFKIDRRLTRMINTKIDLSNDLEDPVKITHIPTIQVLKERLKK